MTLSREQTMALDDDTLERACVAAHDAYEAAAWQFGWRTNPLSRKPWRDVPEANKAAMRAGIHAALAASHLAALDEVERLRLELKAAELFGIGFFQAAPSVQDVYRDMARAALEDRT